MAAHITARILRAILRLTDIRTKRFWILFVLFALPISYVLSIGPLFWLDVHGYLARTPFRPLIESVYQPLNWLARTYPAINEPLSWYLDLWVL